MAVKKRSEVAEELVYARLQAVLLADSFAQKFEPITLERPKVLLPLVNIPMIDYSLAWLESSGVEEVFVLCCSHSKQVIDYLEKSQWFSLPKFTVKTIVSNDSFSVGDALRFIYQLHVIHGDFVLISGDTVTNMSLTEALKEHKERRKKDTNAVMTMVIKQTKPSLSRRLGTNGELFIATDPDTKQLVYYDDNYSNALISLDKGLLVDNPVITLHNDKQDCYIDICSPEVLSLFTDNFDYQHLRHHFVKGLLLDDIMGYKIFTHEIHSSYAARVDNYRSYDTISKDIMQRWSFPFVPDVQFFGNCHCPTKLERQGKYRAYSEKMQSGSANLGPFTLVGNGTNIGDNSKISNSVIGERCTIGSNVAIEGSYIWNNVTIQDGCKLRHAIICDRVIIKSGAVLEPGVVLSFKVVVGPHFIVPAYSKVSLLPQPNNQDSDDDDELEYAESNSGIVESTSLTPNGEVTSKSSDIDEVGVSGVGYVWSACEEEWRHSIAPIPADKLIELIDAAHADHPPELITEDGGNSEDDTEDPRDDSYFEKEVEATFLRAVDEGVELDHVIIEVNSLRLSYNMEFTDCAGAIFSSVMKLAFKSPYGTNGELYKNVATVVTTWGAILRQYMQSVDEEIEVIMKFEEMCLESAIVFAPLFAKILQLLYDKDVLSEDAIVSWAAEREEADEADKIFVKQSEAFIRWLNKASEEEEEEEDDE